ncbi:MAG: DNA methyltransferase [Pirellulales bacterium]
MATARIQPGLVRDAIIAFLAAHKESATVGQICAAVRGELGRVVPQSSVRSYLNLNVPAVFQRTKPGRYELSIRRKRSLTGNAAEGHGTIDHSPAFSLTIFEGEKRPTFKFGRTTLFQDDCFRWLQQRDERSIQAVVTDPPYGLVEYSEDELAKLRRGRGGVWRIPPAFDGCKRSPLPRFTTLTPTQIDDIVKFFGLWAKLIRRVLVPGAHVFVASNPLVSFAIAKALADSGLERRGEIIRLVMTLRGGDRPKNAHDEFPDVSVMPRSMWEPWLLFREPLDGRVQDNLRKWKTGALRRTSAERPFGDVIESSPTRKLERAIAPHPSLKPQAYLRKIVRASLPLGEGTVLDPFAGAGSTLAACEYLGYSSLGIESDSGYWKIAKSAIPRLAAYQPRSDR